MDRTVLTIVALVGGMAWPSQSGRAEQFDSEIRPVLEEHCGACHSDGSTGRAAFLEARSESDVAAHSALWQSVAMQLRNRTMPPHPLPGPSVPERLQLAEWIEQTVRTRACDTGLYAAPVTVRRLNRHEYANTVSDLFGLRLDVAEMFPVDGSGGEGFDNNGETLFLSPLLAERYLEVAEQILDRVIVTPPLVRSFVARELLPGQPADDHESVELAAGDLVERPIPFYSGGTYAVKAVVLSPEPDSQPRLEVLVDATPVDSLRFAWSAAQATGRATNIAVGSGEHRVGLRLAQGSPPVRLITMDVEQRAAEVSDAKRAAHYRLFGREPGTTIISARSEAGLLLERFLRRAYRRPVERAEVEPFLELFDRSAQRGEPFEEGVRFALKAVLVSPEFLFRVEISQGAQERHALSSHELATRLSYFLWGSMPDAELQNLADNGRLQEDAVLAAQVDRLLDHPRSRFFAETLIGQWLGTKDVGGRVAPTLNEIQHFYTPKIAADMREEPVLLFQRMLAEDRSILEFITADYTYLTERLAQFIGMPGAVRGNEFRLVSTSDGRRGGLLGMAAVQAMNSEYRRGSPILRGVWVLETFFGTRVPPPPPDVPQIKAEDGKEGGLTNRQLVELHRAAPACASCHNVIDPIGFAFENYDWLGRWRDADGQGNAINASAALPSGEEFAGLQGLRGILMQRQDAVVRQIVRKLLGYGLGRSLLDRDSCAVETIVAEAGEAGFGARSVIRQIALSVPFRYSQAEFR